MTEAEWLAADKPPLMFDWLAGWSPTPGERKRRLLLAGCARQVWGQIPPGHMRDAVETAERCADGAATAGELREVHRRYFDVAARGELRTHADPHLLFLSYAASAADRVIARPHVSTHWGGLAKFTGQALPGLIRDVFGNPFRPVTPDPRWRTAAVLSLATTMYESRDLAPMPVLADALEEDGCDNADILAHCRSTGPHVRGCWVVDLILGKS